MLSAKEEAFNKTPSHFCGIMGKIEKIEEDLRDIKLSFPKHKNDYIEDMCNFPPFVKAFDKILGEIGRVPTQDEFVDGYVRAYSNSINTIIHNKHKYMKHIKARLRRAYPSIIRDYHFYNLLDVYYEGEYKYSFSNDIKGIDFKLKYKEIWFYIHMFVDTKRSRKYREKKNKRHTFNDKNRHIDLKLDFSDSKTKKVSEFYLYSKAHIDWLKNEMNKRVII